MSNDHIVLNEVKEDITLILLNGNTVTVKIDYPKWSILQGNREIAGIDVKDIQGVNGVVHQIDRVLIP